MIICKSAFALAPPDGCNADSYLVAPNASDPNGYMTVVFYSQGAVACVSNYPTDPVWSPYIYGVGLTPLADQTEIKKQDLIDFQTNLSSIISFFAGVLAITAFIMGTRGGGGGA